MRKTVKFPALSKEAQVAIRPRFMEIWQSVRNEAPMVKDHRLGLLLIGTLLGVAEAFDYLPTEERVKIFTLADWFWRWGYILGRKPDVATRLFHSVEPLWVEVGRPKWFKSLLREYEL